ncbi:23S rRNA (uracil(1939)-C(5))-methyltransferase [hydrothermal vent metagenome]|uniref:23S rRNA (Uracil(1939)-C(5))-methyltransferase n=1 Tax=hydrothermal vent metagenome TaxID=652676 RepID=A0A3B0XJP9_9ZZZZ
MSKRRKRRQRPPEALVVVTIESLSPEGRGVAHVDGKVVFVDFALAGEVVEFKYTRMSKKFDEASAVNIITASEDRVEPICQHFTVCGGCSMQHQEHVAQGQSKQNALMHQFQFLGQVQPDEILPPLRGPLKHYRQKARLSVKYVVKKEKVLVGFREKASSFLADIVACPVLHESVGLHITDLSNLMITLDAKQTIPQIEVAVDDTKTALVFRHLEDLSAHDKSALIAYAQQYDVQVMLQSGGPDTIASLWPENPPPLSYTLKEQDVTIEFQVNDFTQVNSDINQAMVSNALQMLQLKSQDKVLDLFCGLGNFTLAMAKQCAEVTGVEGTQAMVLKARENAIRNNIENVQFYTADLSKDISMEPWLYNAEKTQKYDKILLDPPRSGAMEMLKYIGKINASRIVYVSCNPATLARDANVLVHEHGYALAQAGVMDMFPHTAHVESIALFTKG